MDIKDFHNMRVIIQHDKNTNTLYFTDELGVPFLFEDAFTITQALGEYILNYDPETIRENRFKIWRDVHATIKHENPLLRRVEGFVLLYRREDTNLYYFDIMHHFKSPTWKLKQLQKEFYPTKIELVFAEKHYHAKNLIKFFQNKFQSRIQQDNGYALSLDDIKYISTYKFIDDYNEWDGNPANYLPDYTMCTECERTFNTHNHASSECAYCEGVFCSFECSWNHKCKFGDKSK
ncbi:hypothetical protein [Aneurinibacillus aneurinilyticus]|uniref:hypothetical protein n=1 Tax=Aneurinibacillus aneurinilyticus TaxID=1391 RepID=UPI0023EFFB90|nr:hypothetical protein [Aneurinibacillus aneurinilyticus]